MQGGRVWALRRQDQLVGSPPWPRLYYRGKVDLALDPRNRTRKKQKNTSGVAVRIKD